MDISDDDTNEVMQLMEEEVEEEEAHEMFYNNTLLAVLLIIHGVNEDRVQRIQRRNPSRLYLCRPQLLPNPRISTPWQQLYLSRNDRAYITTMGLNVATFDAILEAGFSQNWNLRVLPRDDVNQAGISRPHLRSLDAAGALGLILHFLSSTMRDLSLQEIFALIPTTVSRYNKHSLTVLLMTLRLMPDASIVWPDAGEMDENTQLICTRHPLLQGAFGSVDGLKLMVETSDDIEIENATYNGWLHEHFISSVLAFSAKGTIIACNLNAPGSWHDSRVAQPIYEKLLAQTPADFYLVADTAFPRGTDHIHGKIRAPMKAGQNLPRNTVERDELLAYDRELLSYRQTAEWGMRALQGSFGRLRMPLPINNMKYRADLLETCIRLHNLRTRLVGINQIRTVYESIWREGDQANVWAGFENMMLGEQRRRDRVSSYHVVASFE